MNGPMNLGILNFRRILGCFFLQEAMPGNRHEAWSASNFNHMKLQKLVVFGERMIHFSGPQTLNMIHLLWLQIGCL